MNRRDFLRRSALLAAGTIAADQLDLIERLGWRRRLFPGWSPTELDCKAVKALPGESYATTFPEPSPGYWVPRGFEYRGKRGPQFVALPGMATLTYTGRA